jgi:hypothetical protein
MYKYIYDILNRKFNVHYLHGAVSIFKSWQLLSKSWNSPPFMEPEGIHKKQLLDLALFKTGPEHTDIHYFFKIYLIFSFHLLLSLLSILCAIFDYSFIHPSSLHECYLPSPAQRFRFNQPNSIWWRIWSSSFACWEECHKFHNYSAYILQFLQISAVCIAAEHEFICFVLFTQILKFWHCLLQHKKS